VQTLPRRGYRFLAPVSADEDLPVVNEASPETRKLVTEEPPSAEDRSQVDLSEKTGPRERLRWLLAWKRSGFALLLVLGILVVWMLRPKNSASPLIRSLAVLPLENLSGDASQEYFSDGMTDELITELGQIRELRVISRSSVMTYKGAHKPLPQIARELNVDAVVEGTVLRSREQVRITAQLILANADKHLWAQSYQGDVGETLALQKQVARAITEQIRIELTPEERDVLKNVKAVNAEAYEAYLKGRYFWNKRTADGLKKAIDYFNQAIEKDPTYAQAYSGLADSYALLGDWEYGVLAPKEAYPRAKAAATKALELDSALGEAHISLAFALDGFDWDFGAAETEFKRGIELNPGYATGHQWYAGHLILFGRSSEAIAEMRKAEDLDPLSLIIGADLAEDFLIAHRYDEAILQIQKTMDLDANFALAHYQLGQAFLQKHRYNEAVAQLQEAVSLSGGSTTCTSSLAYAYAVSGRKNEAEAILNDLKSRSNDSFSNAPEIALVYVGLDQRDQAMAWLEKGYAERFNPGVLLRPSFEPLRSDPRFQDLLHRIGLNR
jgi:TolB-like protein/Flp pilus assembly protein TadD